MAKKNNRWLDPDAHRRVKSVSKEYCPGCQKELRPSSKVVVLAGAPVRTNGKMIFPVRDGLLCSCGLIKVVGVVRYYEW